MGRKTRIRSTARAGKHGENKQKLNAWARTARREQDDPTDLCPTSGKRMFTLEVDVHLRYRRADVKPRAYLCPDCNHWHATQLQEWVEL